VSPSQSGTLLPAGILWRLTTPAASCSTSLAGRHTLLTGDLERSGLDELVSLRGRTAARGHARSSSRGRTANPEWLYEWARPRLVVASQRPSVSATTTLSRQLSGWEAVCEPGAGPIRIRWTDDGIVARGFRTRHEEPLTRIGQRQVDGVPTRIPAWTGARIRGLVAQFRAEVPDGLVGSPWARSPASSWRWSRSEHGRS